MEKSNLEKYAEIQALVQKEARAIAMEVYKKEGTQFGVAKVPYHIHNGTDSPEIVSPSVSYIGFIPYEAPYDTTATLQFCIPGGWSARQDSTGVYTVVHNLGGITNSNFYSFVANATQSTNNVVTPVVTMFENEVTVSWFDTATQLAIDTSFCFILTTGNNRGPFRPQYVTKNMI